MLSLIVVSHFINAQEVKATELENVWEAIRILESICRNLTIKVRRNTSVVK